MKSYFKPLISTLLGLLVAPISNAGFMTFTDRALFEDNLGAVITDDYSSGEYFSGDLSDGALLDIHSNANMSAVFGETDYQSTGFGSFENNIIAGQESNPFYCAGCNGSFTLGFTTTSIGDANGVFGAGFDFTNSDSNTQYHAFVTFGDSSTQDFLLPISNGLEEFFGITSDAQIKSIALGLANGGTTSFGSFGIDNLTIGTAPVGTVPAPATLALFGLGLAGLSCSKRKKVLRMKPSH